jgi:hypothetical protein
MIFDMDGKPLVGGIKTGTLGDGPAFESTVELKAEVVMQTGRVVFLDEIAELSSARAAELAFRLLGQLEIASRVVAIEGRCARAVATLMDRCCRGDQG